MSQGKAYEKKMDNLIIEDTIQKENIPFYQYSEFENVKLIAANIFKAAFKISQKTIALKCVSLNDKFTLENLTNEIKRHRKLEIHDSILKFYGITKQEDTNNYMIILEYVNEGSLRQYLKTNFQKMDWNAKLNLAKQIANVLMFLHSNDIIYEKLNPENIFVHNGIIKFNVFGITKIISDSLSYLTNTLGPIQYMDPQYLELFSMIGKNKSSDIFGLGITLWEISSGIPPFEMESSSNVDLLNNIVKEKREIVIPGTPHKYKEIYTDCWNNNGNLRPDIFQVVKNLSEIIISDTSVEFEPPQSQPYNVTDVKLENLNRQNEEPIIKSNLPFNVTTEVNEGKVQAYSKPSRKCEAVKSLYDDKYFMDKLQNINAVNCYHDNINFHGISMDLLMETYYLMFQNAKKSNLRTYLQKNFEELDWKTKINMSKDLARGLQFIHQANLVNRYLNPNNILIHEERLIADFELSKSLDSDSDPDCIPIPNTSSEFYSLGEFYDLDILYTVKSDGRETPIQRTPLDYFDNNSCAWNHNPTQRSIIEYTYNSLGNSLDNSLGNIEKFEKDSVSSCSSSLRTTDINYTYDHANTNNSYNRTSNPSIFLLNTFRASNPIIEYNGKASPHNCNDHERFDDIIKNDEIIKYDYDDFKNLIHIGEGAFGSVYSATLTDKEMTTMKVALKFIVCDSIKLFVNELKQHSKVCSHENIIGFYGVSQKYENSNEYLLVLEYANGGTLRNYLESNFKNLEWSDKLNLAQQIAKGIQHLHSHNVIHRDLHSKNILIHNNIIKISDFGLAKFISDPSITLLKLAGSIEYSDPMLLIEWENFNRTKASDIFSFGILLWEISSGEIPYKQYSGLSKMFHITKGNRETPVIGTPQNYINIYKGCWKQEPNQRPKIDEVIQVLEQC
ncbi:hypothetical protein Glove_54g159 [Diversispora epigaea]|uniref:Protein kinase domain-containing protein n=1 Tax=Diversispora epigaea TaxID=1348612 RepID=A0A397JET4_9GLOM|nr:hypothetical protein Glove_54g159 [Diversispora epigaea]